MLSVPVTESRLGQWPWIYKGFFFVVSTKYQCSKHKWKVWAPSNLTSAAHQTTPWRKWTNTNTSQVYIYLGLWVCRTDPHLYPIPIRGFTLSRYITQDQAQSKHFKLWFPGKGISNCAPNWVAGWSLSPSHCILLERRIPPLPNVCML